MGFFSWLFRRNKPKKIKIGLALGSGGAKGFAHLGALKAFEENGIEFDVIAGTSIGSVIGAFIAEGYSSTDISELLKRIDFNEIKNLFMIKMDTSGMFKVIDREIGSLSFEEMKKPFKAVATELETGKEHVFDSGNVAKAICASSSIPPFFKPVVIDGVRYIDGAYTNSIPADLVKEMGADYVIGIDLSTKNSKASLLSKIFPTYKSEVENPKEKGYEFSDTMLHPNLNNYSSISIGSGSQMYDIGYQEAKAHMEKIKQDIKELTYGKKKKK
ncbi:MAG: patatin-like phospholipase family protein [Clostridia bacterium]|nr:patatin-like phospholipase family protein [Clostridia bacterium]